jgi:hypothetical protein
MLVASCGFSPSPIAGAGGDAATDGAADVADAPSDIAHGATVTATFGERATADHRGVTRDTYVESAASTALHGSDVGVWADASPTTNGLLKFDLAAVPPASSVSVAELDLVTTTDSLENGTVQIFAILEGWQESTATWIDRQTGMPWAGAGVTGASRGTALIGEFFPGVDSTEYAVALDVATVEKWIAMPGSNRGMVLASTSPTGNGVTFSSSDEPNTAVRPLLRVTFTAP